MVSVHINLGCTRDGMGREGIGVGLAKGVPSC